MPKNRFEAMTDGVLAIVITIIVLELRIPDGGSWSDFVPTLLPVFVYFVSFLFITIFWVNHHRLFKDVESISPKVMWTNAAWLFATSLIPILTVWAGEYPTSYAPLCVYYGDMFLACALFHLMYYLVKTENGGTFILRPRSIISLSVYLLAAAFGGFAPAAAFAAVVLVSCWWIWAVSTQDDGEGAED